VLMDEPTVDSISEIQTPSSPAASTDDVRRVADIISRGQRSRPGAFGTFVFAMFSTVLLWAAFTPLDFGPLAWISLVPLFCLILPARRTRWMYGIVFLCGFCFWLVTLQWMRLGDPTMILALLALAGYLACYWPVFLWLSRTAVHRFSIPICLAAPVCWVGLEYLRSHLITGFAWYLLGHTQYRWVNLIQITDLLGVYGISFLIVLANAAITQLIPLRTFSRWNLCWLQEEETVRQASTRQQLLGGGMAVTLVVLASLYGLVRRSHGDFPLGPRVGLIQGNFVASVRNNTDSPQEIYMQHRHLTGLTLSEEPDLIVWPEGMFPSGLYEVDPGVTDAELTSISPIPAAVWKDSGPQRALQDLADMTNAALVIGTTSFVAHADSYSLYNSAVLVQPDAGITNRYDKIHRVPFGEYIPLKDSLPFLQSLTPFRGKFGIDAGIQAHVFRWKEWQLIPIICFEDTVPQLVRKIARSANLNGSVQNQVLVNLTNDGWFHGSSELDQHLITSQFRAIETRTPLVRAVNTGISAVIDGDGVVREAVKFFDAGPHDDDNETIRDSMRDKRTGRLHKQLSCAIVADVPLDPRTSWYITWGDWFAAGCLMACAAIGLSGIFRRRETVGGK